MDPPMVDARGLIDFCKAFEQHRAMAAAATHRTSSSRRRAKTLNPLSHPFCSHSPFAAIDAVILLLVLAAASVLALPYFRLILQQASHLFPAVLDLVADAMYNAPIAYAFAFVLAFVAGLAVWEFSCYQSRKCGKPGCQGLKNPVEFDIQIESEECVNSFRFAGRNHLFGPVVLPLQVGRDKDELEAELKKMAPTNGRTVLVFRAPCGCSAGRMDVWGAKKNKRTKR